LNIFVQCLYSVDENTAQLVSGCRFTPIPNMNIYVGFPMALGSREGTYYTHNADRKERPASIVLAVSISGNYRFSHYD
jgi:hypothetical protein